MEPCSIVEAASTTPGLCSKLYNFFSALAAAEEEILHLTSQLDAFNRLLPLIGQYGNDTLDSELSALELLSHEALWGILRNCILDFKNLYEAVRDCKPDTDLPTLRNLKRKFSWVLERDQIQKFATRLTNAKQNLTLALHVSGRTNELRALNMLSEVKDSVDSQERKVSELLRSLERFLPLLEKASQEYNKSFERLEVESKTRLDDLSESMSSNFHFFQEEPAPETFMVESDGSQEVFAETKLDHSEGDDFEPKERRSSTFAENEAELVESMKLFAECFNEVKALERSKFGCFSKFDSISPLDNEEAKNLIMGGIEEACETLRLCEREYALYPTTEIRDAMASLHATALQFLSLCMNVLRNSRAKRKHFSTRDDRYLDEIRHGLSGIVRISHKVKEQVEYQHKVEMRGMSQRVHMIQRDQQRILTGIQCQMKILQSLKDQRSVVVVMKEQEGILFDIEKVVIKMRKKQLNLPSSADERRS